ncbi:YybH family protein [Knoellia sp. CPCC 206453]|uniref:YybH family protein n=1 Tax=Knoellia pratensis TaxID=3404796 RepID=UPI00361F1325
MKRTFAAALLGATALTLVTGAGVAHAGGKSTGCGAAFNQAVQAYRQTTFAKDAAGFNALLAEDVTAIFANGSTLYGKDETAAFITDFFADPEWTQTLDVVRETRQGCQSGFVLFDSVYTPSPEAAPVPLAIGVTFVHTGGRWLVIQNQDSDGPVTR